MREIGSRVELFVDDWLIDRMRGVRRMLHAPERREVVLAMTPPAESPGACYFNCFLDEGRLRLYYRGVTAGGDDVAFAGTAGAVAARAAGVTLTLAASGEVRRGAYALSAPSAASLQITPRSAALLLPDGGAGGEFTVQLPDGWTLQAPPAGVTLTAEGPRSRIRVPAGIRRVVLGP